MRVTTSPRHHVTSAAVAADYAARETARTRRAFPNSSPQELETVYRRAYAAHLSGRVVD